jgi:hypothetical protein
MWLRNSKYQEGGEKYSLRSFLELAVYLMWYNLCDVLSEHQMFGIFSTSCEIHKCLEFFVDNLKGKDSL